METREMMSEARLNKLFLKELKHQRLIKIARINKALDISQAITLGVCKISKQDSVPFTDSFNAMRAIVNALKA